MERGDEEMQQGIASINTQATMDDSIARQIESLRQHEQTTELKRSQDEVQSLPRELQKKTQEPAGWDKEEMLKMVINAVELASSNNANKQADQRQDSYDHRGTGDHRSDRACRDFARGSCNYNNCSFRHDKGDQDRQTGRNKDKRDNGRSRESNNSSNQKK